MTFTFEYMDNDFLSLTHNLLTVEPDSSVWNAALCKVVDRVLRSRKIVKRHANLPLAEIQVEIYTALEAALSAWIRQLCMKVTKPRSLTLNTLQLQLEPITQQVLTYERLTQLAIHLQQQPFRSIAWQYALDDLFSAVYLSGKLKYPTTHGNKDMRSDITNEALMQAIRDIQKFDPTRAHFIGWINQVYINRRGVDIRHQQEDTLKRSHHRRIMPIKYALKQIFLKAQPAACRQHLSLYIKCCADGTQIDSTEANCIKNNSIKQDICLNLSLSLCLIQRQIQDEPMAGNQLLFAMAEAITGRSVEFDSLDVPVRAQDGSGQAKEIAAPVPAAPPKIDFLRDCLQHHHSDDCGEILGKHIKSNAQATLRTIALQRIEGKTLKEISQTFNIVIPTIQKFYERNMLKAAECLRRCVEDRIALWDMQHSRG
ncbi:MAG: hypothetical protein HLUCCA11_22085 [Phormidesmis priestleyi Ana]|uniref:Uncharacterized protein n=1 Tax=Phormidesmis priestleyi Ana TaxID=1666911 RepID=A0A0N8KLY2_9CYAN|nr:MAG: hypothetical protein HLUCCA11_22085 [Phormidesmis priestleyi Ana]